MRLEYVYETEKRKVKKIIENSVARKLHYLPTVPKTQQGSELTPTPQGAAGSSPQSSVPVTQAGRLSFDSATGTFMVSRHVGEVSVLCSGSSPSQFVGA